MASMAPPLDPPLALRWQSEPPFRPREKTVEKQRYFQSIHMTAYLNGVLVQDHFHLTGPTSHQVRTDYASHPDKLSLVLQNHGSPVRSRGSGAYSASSALSR